MSLFLRRISNLSLTKKPISSYFSTATPSRSKPYLLLDTEIKENILNFKLYDLTINQEVVKNLKIQDQSETRRNLFQESQKIGSSRGYLLLRNKKDSSVHLVDISNPLKPKIISLPPLHFEEHVNVSVSSPVKGDIIVAVKFCGSGLSLCRVGDSEWTQIDVCSSLYFSSVIYSERDERFYLNSYKRPYIGPIDFTTKSGLVTPVSVSFKFPVSNFKEFKKDVPSLSDFEVQELLVESPSGQLFIVDRFYGCFNEKGEMVDCDDDPESKDIIEKTQKIFVFKEDEAKEMCSYTNDIGDLCIFIGQNEAFCVSANDYPSLKPNSVYFAGHGSGFGVCDLSSQTILHFSDNLTSHPFAPIFWIPPTLIS